MWVVLRPTRNLYLHNAGAYVLLHSEYINQRSNGEVNVDCLYLIGLLNGNLIYFYCLYSIVLQSKTQLSYEMNYNVSIYMCFTMVLSSTFI